MPTIPAHTPPLLARTPPPTPHSTLRPPTLPPAPPAGLCRAREQVRAPPFRGYVGLFLRFLLRVALRDLFCARVRARLQSRRPPQSTRVRVGYSYRFTRNVGGRRGMRQHRAPPAPWSPRHRRRRRRRDPGWPRSPSVLRETPKIPALPDPLQNGSGKARVYTDLLRTATWPRLLGNIRRSKTLASDHLPHPLRLATRRNLRH